MEVLVNIIIRFLSQLIGRWISFTALKVLIQEVALRYKTVILSAIGTFLYDLLKWIVDNITSEDVRHPQAALSRFLLEELGLQIDEFSKEGMKKAAGQLLADKVNLRYGTAFKAFYPPENIIEQIKSQLQLEIIEALSDGI